MKTRRFTSKPCRNGHLAERSIQTNECVECRRLRIKRYRARNPGKASEHRKRAYQKHAEARRTYSRQYREDHLQSDEQRAAKAAYDREYRPLNKDRMDAVKAAWRAKNKELIRSVKSNYKHRRRAQESGGISSGDLKRWVAAEQKVCYWCDNACPDDYTIDHYEPLSRGGKHEAENLVIACRHCNVTKHAKDPYVFAQSVGRLF